MSPAADNASSVQSSVPLLSRRRGSLSSDNGGADIEQGGGLGGGAEIGATAAVTGTGDESISVRVKTAGDGREYKLSTPLTETVAQVSELR